MKNRLIGIAALASALIGGGAVMASNAYAQQVPTATVVTSIEKHPELRKALRQLNNSLTTMQNAADDFHGHKKKAMELTNGAIAELKAALASDRH